MKYEFTLNELPASLDTDKGIFTYEDEEIKKVIDETIADAKSWGRWGGGTSIYVGIDITDPYCDIYQFTACLYTAMAGNHLPKIRGSDTDKYFPKELYPYAPCLAGLCEDIPPINVFLGTKEEFEAYGDKLEEMEKFGVVF